MKPKLKKTLIILLFLLITSCWLLITSFNVLAAYKIEVSIPVPGGPTSGELVTLTQYIRYLYLFGLGAVGIAALGALVIGGFMYMLSDTVTSKDKAKEYIWGALSGLVLGLAAYLILNTINPDLVKIKGPELPEIKLPEAQTKEFKSKEETAKTIRYNFDAKAEAYNTKKNV
jgi:hypothetical protein